MVERTLQKMGYKGSQKKHQNVSVDHCHQK